MGPAETLVIVILGAIAITLGFVGLLAGIGGFVLLMRANRPPSREPTEELTRPAEPEGSTTPTRVDRERFPEPDPDELPTVIDEDHVDTDEVTLDDATVVMGSEALRNLYPSSFDEADETETTEVRVVDQSGHLLEESTGLGRVVATEEN